MAHQQQRDFFAKLKLKYPDAFTGVDVLEVGSLNINGTVRDFFDAKKYVGVDVGEGPGVDVVAQGQDLDYEDGLFDVAVSAECFEHNPYWAETFSNMHRMASRYVFFTCATDGRAEHGTSRTDPGSSPLTMEWDYYQNLNEQHFQEAFDLTAMFESFFFETNDVSHDIYFCGIKR